MKTSVEQKLAARAKAEGLTTEEFVNRELEKLVAAQPQSSFEATNDEEWEAALEAFAQSPVIQNISWPVDDSRESIYREREDAQL